MMKKLLYFGSLVAVVLIFGGIIYASYHSKTVEKPVVVQNDESTALAGNITPLEQFTATTSPVSAITQRTYGKSVMLTGLTTGLCLTLDANNVITTTTCGSGGGSSAYEIATTSTIAVPQLAYFTKTGGRTTLGGVATSSLSVGASLSSSGTLGAQIGGTASQLSINTANTNTWSVLQNFNYSSSTAYASFVLSSTTDAYFGTGQGIAYIGSGGRLRTTATSTFSLSGFTNDLATLSAGDTSLTFSGSYNGATARTVTLNVGNANTWTARQNFANATSTLFSSNYASTTELHVGSGQGYGYIGSNGLFGVISTSTLASNLTSSCATITGGAGLCDGVDDTGSATWPFTPATNFNQNTQSTTTALWLKGSPYSLFASSTAYFDNIYVATSTGKATSTIQNLGSVGLDATAFPGADIGDQINNAYIALPSTGGIIRVPAGTYSFTTKINFSTSQKPVLLSCAPGGATTLNWTTTTTSTSTVFNLAPANYQKAGWGVENCEFIGTATGYTNPTVGIEIGGSNGGMGFVMRGVKVSKFGIGVTAGDNSYNININNSQLAVNGKAFMSQCTTNCGELWRFTDSWFVDNRYQGVADAHYCMHFPRDIATIEMTNSSFDDCQIRVGPGVQRINISGAHFENPEHGTLISDYEYIYIEPSAYTYANVSDSLFMNSSTTASVATIYDGGWLQLNNISVIPNGVSAVPWTSLVTTDSSGGGGSGTVQMNGVCNHNNDTNFGFTYPADGVNSLNSGTTRYCINHLAITTHSWPYIMQQDSSNYVKFYNGGSARLTLDLNGNFGIATTVPKWKLSIASTTMPQLALLGNNTDNVWTFRGIGNTFSIATASPTTYATSSATAFKIDANGFPYFSSVSSASGSNCLQIDTTGKITNTGSTCGSSAFSGSPFTIVGTDGSGALVSTSSNPLWVTRIIATSTTAGSGFGTSTPGAMLSINNPGGIPALLIGSSTTSTSTALAILANGNAMFGTSTQITESGINSMVAFVSDTANDAYVTFRNVTSGKAMVERIRANSDYAHFDILTTNSAWLLGTVGTSNFVVWDDTGAGVSILEIEKGALADSLYIKTITGNVGIASTTPLARLSVNPVAGDSYAFAVGSSTKDLFRISTNGVFTMGTTTAGCLNVNTSGLIYSATCSAGGGVTSVVAGAGFLNQGLNITSSGTLIGALATATTPTIGQLAYWSTVGDTSVPAKLNSVATSSISNGTGISFSGTAGAIVGGSGFTITNSSPLSGLTTSFPLSFSNPALSWIGLATSSNLTNGRVHYSTGVNTFADVATSSIANGTGITVTNGSSAYVIGSQPTINCNTANASTFGCLSASDFSKFNSATTTFTWPLIYTGATNAVTFGWSTTTALSAGQAIYASGVNTFASVSTSTPTIGASLSYSGTMGNVFGGSSGTLSLNMANANSWTANQTFQYSSSTIYSSFAIASSTNWLGGGLQTCDPTTGKLTWSNGQFACGTDQTGGASFSGAGNSIIVSNSAGNALVSTSSDPLYISSLMSTSTTKKSGFGTSTPGSFVSINNPGGMPAFTVGSSTTGTSTAFTILANGHSLFGTTTEQSESGLNAFVAFVNDDSNDSYVTFKNVTSGKSMAFRVRANSAYAHFDILGTGYSWLVGGFGDTTFRIWDDSGAGISVFLIEQGAPANSLYVDTSGTVGISTSTAMAIFTVATTTTKTGTNVPLMALASTSKAGNPPNFMWDRFTHRTFTGVKTTVSSCGTSPVINGNDTLGTVLVGSGASTVSCTITFANSWGTLDANHWLVCPVQMATSSTAVTISASTTATTLVVGFSVSRSSNRFNYGPCGLVNIN